MGVQCEPTTARLTHFKLNILECDARKDFIRHIGIVITFSLFSLRWFVFKNSAFNLTLNFVVKCELFRKSNSFFHHNRYHLNRASLYLIRNVFYNFFSYVIKMQLSYSWIIVKWFLCKFNYCWALFCLIWIFATVKVWVEE